MKASFALLGFLTTATAAVAADAPPFLAPGHSKALATELSGAAAKQTVEILSRHHRMRGSRPYAAAAQHIEGRLAAYGLAEIETIALPADGSQFYGTQRARPAWNARFAELWEQKLRGGRWVDGDRIASWADQPITLAQDSVAGKATADLVDIGAGTSDKDFAGKAVRGKLVLTSSQPEAAAPLAIAKYGAAGIVSWAQNQKTGWWGEDEQLIRWGHLDTWKHPAFAFMVSPATARRWQATLATGGQVHLRAEVDAGRSPGEYRIPTAVIPGRRRDQEIVFSCHLDHPSPGANDNASGCAGELEIARMLQRLIADRKLPPPERTIRFIWPCEVECTISLLNARPEFATRTLATIHLDMIGGDTDVTKSVLQVEGSPPSLPSFVDDIAFSLGRWVNDATREFADTGAGEWALLDAKGSKRSLQAEVGGFSEGSDHTVWAEGSWRIPVVYLADWPDRYIHTHKDVPGNLDPTKMKRAMFIAAATGWTLANLDQAQVPAVERAMEAGLLELRAASLRRPEPMPEDARLAAQVRDRAKIAESASLARFGLRQSGTLPQVGPVVPHANGSGAVVYRRKLSPKGPMDGFGYSWLDDRLDQSGTKRPTLLARESGRDGPSFGYEALNLVDGERSVAEIRAHLAATVGPVPMEEVADYLSILQQLGLLERN